jgi:flagellar motor switch protein FliG
MAELEAIMKMQFSKSSSSASSSFGGIKAAAKIMNSTKTALEAQIMTGLEKIDADLMQKIQDNMFTFENLVAVDNKGIQKLMSAVEQDLLMIAMKGASAEVQDRFFGNMSERARYVPRRDERQRPHAHCRRGRRAEENHAHCTQIVRLG